MKNNFIYCPKCGSTKNISIKNDKELKCGQCDFVFFHNVAAAACCIIEIDNKILFTVRNRNPQKGKLGFPGGFVDPDENLETTLKRECFEELGINITDFKYFTSFPNIYEYKNVKYFTCDVFFIVKIINTDFTIQHEEIQEIKLIDKNEIIIDNLAFESNKKALKLYLKQNS